ncbi:NACHT, LRR and PYD domains-containing protein 3-like [Mustelus asterias]
MVANQRTQIEVDPKVDPRDHVGSKCWLLEDLQLKIDELDSELQTLRLIREGESYLNIYCVHVDRKSPKPFHSAVQAIASCFSNVFVARKSESVIYASWSRVQADLNCMEELLQSPVPWRYLINLCGQDFPTKTNREIVNSLTPKNGSNILDSVAPPKFKQRRWEFHHNVTQSVVRTNIKKSPPPIRSPMYAGGAYIIVTRTFVSVLFANPEIQAFFKWSEDTYSPDEHVWATLQRMPEIPGYMPYIPGNYESDPVVTRVVKWSFIAGDVAKGAPYPPCTGKYRHQLCVYGSGDLHWIVQQDRLFANKFDAQVDNTAVQCMEEYVRYKSMFKTCNVTRRLPEKQIRRRSTRSSAGRGNNDRKRISSINDILKKCDDYQLFQLTKFYRDRLEQAIEKGVDGVSSLLTYENQFNGQEHRKITELAEKGNRVESSQLLLRLVMDKDAGARRVMWKSFVKMRHAVPKLDKILNELEEIGFDAFENLNLRENLSEVPEQLKGVQQKHKETLRVQTETLKMNTILIKAKVKTFKLVDRYVELTVISTVRDRTLVEDELLARGRVHEEWREKHLRRELEKIRIDQLFQSSFSQFGSLLQKMKHFFQRSSSGISAALSGIPGIGKTMMMQKLIYDWSIGKIYPQFQFVFSFKFRDLNVIKCKTTLKKLVLDQYPYFGNFLGELWKNPEGLLFIFDGLDEFKDSIDFADSQRNAQPQSMCTDPECISDVSEIVYSLIQHKLLPGCSVLVTSRPTALHLLEKAEFSVWAEILGFVGEERKEYFHKFFEHQAVAEVVIKHMEDNEILYTMCYNPSYCWILGLSLGPFFTQKERKEQKVPKTTTQLYSYYIYNILKNHGRESVCPRDVLLKVGKMAFTGISEKKIVFRNKDFIKYNLQPSQFLSGFLVELLENDDSAQSVVYTFPHITLQEFVAALAQFLTTEPRDIQKLLQESHSKEDGRFEVVLRFAAGLSSPQSAWPLEEILGPFLHKATCEMIDWVKENFLAHIGSAESKIGKRKLLNALHYLFESQNNALARAVVGSIQKLKFGDSNPHYSLRLTPIDCAMLAPIIGICDKIDSFDLQNCYIQYEVLQRLEPVLYKCQILRLSNNELGDSGMKVLSVALRNPDCKIRKLELESVAATNYGAEDLASSLSTNRSLTVLNLGINKLGDSGVKLLSAALSNPKCKIQELQLTVVGLTDSCAMDLSSALSVNMSLMVLNLSYNKLRDSGIKLLSEALRNPKCIIQDLRLDENALTDACAEVLASALTTNRSLMVLSLESNFFTDVSVPALRRLILTCKSLERVGLWGNQFSKGGKRDLKSLRESRLRLLVGVDDFIL